MSKNTATTALHQGLYYVNPPEDRRRTWFGVTAVSEMRCSQSTRQCLGNTLQRGGARHRCRNSAHTRNKLKKQAPFVPSQRSIQTHAHALNITAQEKLEGLLLCDCKKIPILIADEFIAVKDNTRKTVPNHESSNDWRNYIPSAKTSAVRGINLGNITSKAVPRSMDITM